MGGAGPFRVEFSGFQIGDFSGAAGAGSGTSVQFAPGGASNINLSINYPADYCSTDNPQMVTSCFVAINVEDSPPLGLRDALVGVPYQSVDNTKVVSHYGVVNEMGAIWGLAYQRDTKRIFSAAFTKRHVGFGPGGPGAIYATTVGASDTTTAEFFNFGTAAGTDMHTDVPSEVTANDRLDSYDIPAYDAVGKTSLGDIDISDDGKTLYVVNLFNRKLYSLDIATKDTVAYAIPDPGCQGSDFRPFATKFYRGKVYVGVVCSNESTPNDTTIAQTANMLATVYAFEAGSFTPVLTFPLNYIKAPTNSDLTPVTNVARANRWRPWTDTFRADRNTSLVSYPQPWLTDIEFDVDGDMIVGLRDRYGDQMGYFNRKPIANNPDLVSAVSPGEILRAGPCGPGGTWLIENNGSVCGSTASAIQSNQAGPGGGKYYWGDRVQNGGNHGMSSMASFALLAGSGKVAMTAIDPTEIFNTGGIKRMLNPTGAKDGNPTGTSSNPAAGVQLYLADNLGYGKANGLGDLELLCASAPIEIGNRVWKDTNKDGIQDPGELPLVGVTVTLSDSTNAVLATAVTDANGNYIFSSKDSVSASTSFIYNLGLLTNTKYFVKVTALGSDASVTGLNLVNVSPTPGEANVNNSGATLANNDALLAGGFPTIVVRTGATGENNHTYDFGFTACVKPVAGADTTVCQTSLDLIDATRGQQWFVATGNPAPATITDSTGVVTGLNVNGVYQFILRSGGEQQCADTITVTKATFNLDLVARDTTICSTSSVDLTSLIVGYGNLQNPRFYADSVNGLVVPNPMVATPDSTTTYFLVANNALGCTDTTQIVVTVTVKPIAGPDSTVCAGATQVDLSNATSPQAWMLASAYNLTIDPTTGVVTGADLSKPGQYAFLLTASGDPTCSDTLVLTVVPGTSFTATATNPTCTTGGIAGSSGKIEITTGTVGDSYAFNTSGFGSLPTNAGTNLIASLPAIVEDSIANDTSATIIYYLRIFNASGCYKDTSLTIRLVPCYDLALDKAISKSEARVGDTLTYTITLINQGTGRATGVTVVDSLNAGVEYLSSTADQGSYNPNTFVWSVDSVAVGDTLRLRIKVKVVGYGVWFNTAQINTMNEDDTDSTPGNNQDNEDDQERRCFTVPFRICGGERIEAMVPAGYTNVQWFKEGNLTPVATGNTYTITDIGRYRFTASNGNCPADGCCPIVVEAGDCCKPDLCVPFVLTKARRVTLR
ncbi:MAG: DUF11 domain-containing protein [Cytophagaceae bacterium]|nr:DUF11 domain-containing protein [Cytophagaceae bacterium]